MKINKLQINETLLAGIAVLIILSGIYFFDLKQNEGVSPAEYIPTDADTFNEGVFDDGLELTIISPEVGYKTGLEKYPELKWKNMVISEKVPRTSIDVRYPQFIGGEPVKKLNELIEKIIMDVIDEDRARLKEMVRDYPEEFESMLSLASQYRIVGVTQGIVSLEMVITDFTGGGNGNHDSTYNINWDLKSDKLVKAKQLFCSDNYIQVLTPLVHKSIFARLDYPTDKNMIDWIEDGTSPDEPYWNNIQIKDDGIIVVFPPYSIASGASGIIRAFVPNSSIPNLLCLP